MAEPRHMNRVTASDVFLLWGRAREAMVRPAQLPSGGLVGGGRAAEVARRCSPGDAKPTPDLPFGSSANAAFAAPPGNGGSFGIADPDTGIGYGYGPNRLGLGLIDHCELALRNTLDRDVLGERPAPHPAAAAARGAGRRSASSPAEADPEHPPLASAFRQLLIKPAFRVS